MVLCASTMQNMYSIGTSKNKRTCDGRRKGGWEFESPVPKKKCKKLICPQFSNTRFVCFFCLTLSRLESFFMFFYWKNQILSKNFTKWTPMDFSHALCVMMTHFLTNNYVLIGKEKTEYLEYFLALQTSCSPREVCFKYILTFNLFYGFLFFLVSTFNIFFSV